jgi:LysR family transcriptional regulator, glycine cleavage system transcriptional activator
LVFAEGCRNLPTLREGQEMGFKLPPLSSVRVFEAAARHGSFKKAAEELNITASAVSHAVQNLEDWLGLALFQRGRGKLGLTEPGAAYAAAVGEALKAVADATARLPGRRSQGRLSISAAPGFASRWLMPRLSRFTDRYPEIGVDIETSLKPVDLPMEGIDAAIRLAPPSRATPFWTRLLDESLVPVCSPALREKYRDLSGLELIAHVDLIHMTSISGDWAEWYRIIGVTPPANVRGGLRVDTVNMALEAARRGHGIALGRTPLFEAEIESGQLICLLDERVPSGWSYWLVTMDADFQSQDVKGFRQWLLDEVGVAAAPASKQRPRDRLRQARA